LCTFYGKIYIDAGTDGNKAHSDIYIPKKTICLNDLNFESKKEIPMCTLKNFPTEISHCIEWSKNIFNEIFFLYIKDIKLIFEDLPKFYYILEEEKNVDELFYKIEIIANILNILNNPNIYEIIKLAVFIFVFLFNYKIKKLLED
jgi:ubiquitin-activating enzyme E1